MKEIITKKTWRKLWCIKWFIGIFLAAFGVIWLLTEPLGVETGYPLFGFITVSALGITILSVLASMLYKSHQELLRRSEQIEKLQSELERITTTQRTCCVLQEAVSVCPLGVTAIYSEMQETLRSSILAANHKFRWLGLSAFNVVHNNVKLFEEQKQVEFEFMTIAPENNPLLDEIDKYYMDVPGTLRSAELVQNSSKILKEIQANVHNGIVIRNFNQMPTFRVILIDDSRALVSFYERGIDALKSHQIEITDNPNAKYNILKWFQMFYEKVLLTENLIQPI